MTGPSKMLIHPSSPRLLKRAQMQGGERKTEHPAELRQGVLQVRRKECLSETTP
jgi:hypothetical protein